MPGPDSVVLGSEPESDGRSHTNAQITVPPTHMHTDTCLSWRVLSLSQLDRVDIEWTLSGQALIAPFK